MCDYWFWFVDILCCLPRTVHRSTWIDRTRKIKNLLARRQCTECPKIIHEAQWGDLSLSRASDDNFHNWNAWWPTTLRLARNKWTGHSLEVYVRVRKNSCTEEALNRYERGAFSSVHSLLLCTTNAIVLRVKASFLSEKWFPDTSLES